MRYAALMLLVMIGCRSMRAEHDLKVFVRKAARLVAYEEQAAFARFREKGGQWYDGDTYVFVNSMDGTIVCHPAKPSLQGRNIKTLRDADGNLFGPAWMRDVAEADGAGWARYRWPKPGSDTDVTWKKSYAVRVTAPSGREYAVGSGIYED